MASNVYLYIMIEKQLHDVSIRIHSRLSVAMFVCCHAANFPIRIRIRFRPDQRPWVRCGAVRCGGYIAILHSRILVELIKISK